MLAQHNARLNTFLFTDLFFACCCFMFTSHLFPLTCNWWQRCSQEKQRWSGVGWHKYMRNTIIFKNGTSWVHAWTHVKCLAAWSHSWLLVNDNLGLNLRDASCGLFHSQRAAVANRDTMLFFFCDEIIMCWRSMLKYVCYNTLRRWCWRRNHLEQPLKVCWTMIELLMIHSSFPLYRCIFSPHL